MNYHIYQEYYIKALFINNDLIQNIEVYQKFEDKFNIKCVFNNSEIATIKYQAVGKNHNLDLLEIYNNIKFEDKLEYKINTTDIMYTINIKGKVNRKK